MWFITGSSSGLGRALAEQVLARGERVILTAREPEKLTDLVALYPQTALPVRLDVTSAAEIEAAVQAGLAKFGQIDVLVNNAGRGLVGALEEYSPEQIKNSFDTNFFASVNLIRAVLPGMRERKSGRIVNVSAIAGFANEVGFSIYGAAKFALEGMSEALQSEVRHLGIKVIIVEPGPFRTRFIEQSMDRASSTIDDYKQSSGKFAEFLTKLSGTQAGDPVKGMAAMIKAIDDERPPARLVLGVYANKKVRDKMRRMTSELEQWEETTLATDF